MKRIVTALCLSVNLLSHASTSEIETIALTGRPAPGFADGTYFSVANEANQVTYFAGPLINDRGDVIFRGTVDSPLGTPVGDGLWTGTASALRLVARSGTVAPGTTQDTLFDSFLAASAYRFGFDDTGNTVFGARLNGPNIIPFYLAGSNATGIWTESSGAVTLAARNNASAAGVPTTARYNFENSLTGPVMNERGEFLFTSRVNDSAPNGPIRQGIWTGSPAGVAALAYITMPVASHPGATFNDLGVEGRGPVLNNRGQTAFLGSTVFSGNRPGPGGIWIASQGDLDFFGPPLTPVPGADSSFRFAGGMSDASINDAGDIAFRSLLEASPFVFSSGIWITRSGVLTPRAVRGTVIPGRQDGLQFGQLVRDNRDSPVPINHDGFIAFSGHVEGPGVTIDNNTAIFSDVRGEMELVAREGDLAPGVPDGVVFADLLLSAPALNRLGQLCFVAALAGPGVNFENDEGIWVKDRTGTLMLVAREGDALEIAPNDRRTIQSIGFAGGSGGEDGRGRGLNDRGQIAFFARFTDGSQGIFISNAVAIPEPTYAAFVFVIAVFALGVHCRRRFCR
jgi:hypothetical protein